MSVLHDGMTLADAILAIGDGNYKCLTLIKQLIEDSYGTDQERSAQVWVCALDSLGLIGQKLVDMYEITCEGKYSVFAMRMCAKCMHSNVSVGISFN